MGIAELIEIGHRQPPPGLLKRHTGTLVGGVILRATLNER